MPDESVDIPLQTTPRDVEWESGPQNLGEIELQIERRMDQIASEFGAYYIPPTENEISAKITETLSVNPHIYSKTDEFGNIWAPGGKVGLGLPNVETFNKSSKFGFIVKEKEKSKENEITTRVYRGGRFNPSIPQVAPLARVEGVTTQDIYDYVNGKVNMDSIIEKIKDGQWKESLTRHLQQIRERAEKYGVGELEEITHEHTQYTPGAIGIDLWLSAAKKPENTYGGGNGGNLYGDFMFQDSSGLSVNGIMILDVPNNFIQDYNTEVGILGEIRPEWITAIVPRSGDVEQMAESARKVENYIEREK